MCGDEVWELHLEFVAAARQGVSYSASVQDGLNIREYTQSNEAELALDLILACAAPPLPASLRERVSEVTRLVIPDEPNDEVEAWIDGWLHWTLGSGEQPPHWT